MKTMQATELRQNLYETLTQLAESGEPVEVLRHGRPIAKLCRANNLPAGKRKPLLDLDAIAAFCQAHQATRFGLFGSILRGDFDEKSDVDVWIDLQGRRIMFHEECRMLDELEELFGRKVDLITDAALDSAEMNDFIKTTIKNELRVIYDASL
jgi:predicted nucleotidyltransferase